MPRQTQTLSWHDCALPWAALPRAELVFRAGALFILWECSTPFVYLRWWVAYLLARFARGTVLFTANTSG